MDFLPQNDCCYYYSQQPPIHAPAPLLHQSFTLLSPAAPATAADPPYVPPPHSYYYYYPPPPPPTYNSYYTSIPTPSELLDHSIQHDSLPSPSPPPDSKNETSRKALRRAVASHVGFPPTDIENITSHEKKRQYLECLEYYVSHLQQQISLVGAQPVKMQRVRPVNGRGMSSKSIRTLLVHMAKVNQRLHQKTLAGEQQFVCLRDAATQQSDLLDFPPSIHTIQ